MKRLLKRKTVSPEMVQEELDLDQVLPDHLLIKDIDKEVFDFALIYRHCVDSNEANDQKLLKRRKRRHFFVMAFLLFTTLRFTLYIWEQMKSGSLPDYYFDMTKYFGGITIFFYFIQIIEILMTIRIYYIFGRADTQHMNWLNIIRVLKGISPVNQLSIIDEKDIKHFIKIVKIIHRLIKNTIHSVELCLISWLIFTLISFNTFENAIKYGLILCIIFGIFTEYFFHIVYNSLKFFLIIIFYSIFRMKSLNGHTLSLIKCSKISKNRILNTLSFYNNTLTTICNLNEFWKKVYSTFIYSFLPICLLDLNQMLFQEFSTVLFLSMVAIFMSLIIFTLFLNLMSAQIFKEVLKIEKILFTLLKDIQIGHKIETQSNYK